MSKKFKSNFNFGTPVAESDQLFLSSAYWDNGDFDIIESRVDKRCFIIGRTGSGKSAALHHLSERNPTKVIRIDPESLSLPYILNMDVIKKLLDTGVHLEPFLRALWKHVIVVETLRHRYDINSPEQKQNILKALADKLKRDPAKVKALEYLDNFGDKFWCETDERVQQIADSFSQKLGMDAETGATTPGINSKLSGNAEQTITQEIKRELAVRYQKVINDMQIPKLNQMLVILNNEILDSPQHFTYIVIDDLDKEWVDEELAILLIRELFQAVIDMQQVNHLKIVVALRTNIFQQLNYEKQGRGGQEEKFRALSLDLKWTANDLINLLNARVEAASSYYNIESVNTLTDLLPHANKRTDNPISYILKRTLMRLRDAISFLNNCVREATGKERITWDNITQAEKKYSKERLLGLRDEWKDPYIGIDKVFEVFRECPSKMETGRVSSFFDEVALLLADKDFAGIDWLKPKIEHIFYGTGKSWYELYMPILSLLYSISFIGIARSINGNTVFSHEDPELINNLDLNSQNVLFCVHPAFHQALNIR